MSKFKLKPLVKEEKKEYSQVRLLTDEIDSKFIMIAKGFQVKRDVVRNELIKQMMEGRSVYVLETPTSIVYLPAPLSSINEEFIEETNLEIRKAQEEAKVSEAGEQPDEVEVEVEVETKSQTKKEGFDNINADSDPKDDQDDEEINW